MSNPQAPEIAELIARLETEAGIYTNCRGPLNASGCVEVLPSYLDGTVRLLQQAAEALLRVRSRDEGDRQNEEKNEEATRVDAGQPRRADRQDLPQPATE